MKCNKLVNKLLGKMTNPRVLLLFKRYIVIIKSNNYQRAPRKSLILKPSGALNPEPKKVTFCLLGGAILVITIGTVIGYSIGEYLYSVYGR